MPKRKQAKTKSRKNAGVEMLPDSPVRRTRASMRLLNSLANASEGNNANKEEEGEKDVDNDEDEEDVSVRHSNENTEDQIEELGNESGSVIGNGSELITSGGGNGTSRGGRKRSKTSLVGGVNTTLANANMTTAKKSARGKRKGTRNSKTVPNERSTETYEQNGEEKKEDELLTGSSIANELVTDGSKGTEERPRSSSSSPVPSLNLIEKLIASSLTEVNGKSNESQKHLLLVNSLLKDLSATKNENFEQYKKVVEQKNAITNNLVSLLVQKIAILESKSGADQGLGDEIKSIIQKGDFTDKQQQQQQQYSAALTTTVTNGKNFDRLSDRQKCQLLLKENQELKTKLKKGSLQSLLQDQSSKFQKKTQENLKLTIRELERIIEKHETISDIIESICGVRVNDVNDSDSNNLVFDCTQGGYNGEIHYQLILSRALVSEDPDGDTVEMIYNPILGDDDSEESERVTELKQFLPEYFFENLTFPVETLPQFYQKLARALNKEPKSTN